MVVVVPVLSVAVRVRVRVRGPASTTLVAGPALLLAVALVAPLVAVVGSAEAQPPPPAGSVRPLGVPVDPANPGLFDYCWDAATRAFTPVDDFVRVAPGATVDLHMRANDVVGFAVCPSQEAGQGWWRTPHRGLLAS